MTEDVGITTVSIEVKVIRIGKRQMTQAVFRQLLDAPLVNEPECSLNGEPWGWVNYHQDCPASKHLHMVWQDGSNLRRCTVMAKPWTSRWGGTATSSSWWDKAISDLGNDVGAYALALAIEGQSDYPGSKMVNGSGTWWETKAYDLRVAFHPTDEILELWRLNRELKHAKEVSQQYPDNAYLKQQVGRVAESAVAARAAARDRLAQRSNSHLTSSQDIWDSWVSGSACKMGAYKSAWMHAYGILQEKGQLFIAV